MRSTGQGGGNLVEDGLILYLDAANQRSYPGSGTTWFDLTNNNNHFTLFNAPTYANGSFNFNGSTQYAECVNATCGNFGSSSFTIEYIGLFYWNTSVASYSTIISKRSTMFAPASQSLPGWMERIGANRFWVQDDNPGAGTNNFTNVIEFDSPQTGSLIHVAYTVEKNGTATTGSRYWNGVLASSPGINNPDRKTFIGNNLVDNNNNMLLMRAVNGGNTSVSGSMSIVRLYNKRLTTSEVQQNYNALRYRFGI